MDKKGLVWNLSSMGRYLREVRGLRDLFRVLWSSDEELPENPLPRIL